MNREGEVGVFKFRNYDSTTGAARKHARTEEGETVESAVMGLTEKVLQEDELRRAQELVSPYSKASCSLSSLWGAERGSCGRGVGGKLGLIGLWGVGFNQYSTEET